jgi:hypothetical protein
MKSLSQLTDRKAVYRIEAARISFQVLSDSFNDLRQTLQSISGTECDVPTALKVYKDAWQFVDYTFRFLAVVSQIRGLKHKEPRFASAQRSLPEIERARNFVQHLNSGIPTLSDKTYPILGALAWSEEGGQKSHVLSLGRLPQGTQFHTVAYDTHQGAYVDEVLLCVDTFTVSLGRAFSLAIGCHEYLCDWLASQSLLEGVNHQPTVMTAGPLGEVPGARRFRRVRFVVNTEKPKNGSA